MAIIFTDTKFTAEIDENVTLSWRTSLTLFNEVRGPTDTLFQVQFGTIIPNFSKTKYIFDTPDDWTLNESILNITVMNVKKTDAGLYGLFDLRNRSRCCILVVTSMISISISHQNYYVNNTCRNNNFRLSIVCVKQNGRYLFTNLLNHCDFK